MSRFTLQTEDDFTMSVFGGIFLDTVVGWVADNLDPENVFSESQLENWALENGFTRIN